MSSTETNQDTKIPLMLIITYSRANPNFKELLSKHWSYLGRSSATRELGKHDFMIIYRKPSSLRDILVRARIVQPTTTPLEGCNRPNTCKYCGKISQSGKVKNLNNKTCNTVKNGTCQSNNLIYCLECNWCHMKYVGQTKNRIIDRFQGHILTLNTIITQQWQDTFIATKINWIPE